MNRHFGKISEVWKHGVLGEVLTVERPTRYAETHAGSAGYPLTPSPERNYGVYRFWEHGGDEPAAPGATYRDVLRAEGMEGRAPLCPGSPLVAMHVLGAEAEHLFFDSDPESVADIQMASTRLGLGSRVRTGTVDGLASVATAFAEDPDGVVHIDPFDPLEPGSPGGPSSVELARNLAERGTVIAYWYGYDDPDERFWAWETIALPVSDTVTWWAGDILYAEPESESGIIGCGMLIANASTSSIERCEAFAQSLERMYRDTPLPSGNTGSIGIAARTSA